MHHQLTLGMYQLNIDPICEVAVAGLSVDLHHAPFEEGVILIRGGFDHLRVVFTVATELGFEVDDPGDPLDIADDVDLEWST